MPYDALIQGEQMEALIAWVYDGTGPAFRSVQR